MAGEIITYRGRSIRASAVHGPEGWLWSYNIDGGPPRYCHDGPMRYQDLAVAAALAAAREEVNLQMTRAAAETAKR